MKKWELALCVMTTLFACVMTALLADGYRPKRAYTFRPESDCLEHAAGMANHSCIRWRPRDAAATR